MSDEQKITVVPPQRRRPGWTLWVVAGVVAGSLLAQQMLGDDSSSATTDAAVADSVDESMYDPLGRLESPSGADRAEVQQLLRSRADALMAGDEEAFLATVDAEDDAFREQQAAVFDNLQQLDFDAYSYDVGKAEVYPDEILDQPAYLAPVTVTYDLSGYDEKPVSADDVYSFVRRDAAWLLASVTDAERRLDDEALPWETGPITTVSDDRFLVIVDEDDEALGQRILAACASSVDKVAGLVGSSFDGTVVVDATTSTDEWGLMGFENAAAAAYSVGDDHDTARWEVVGWRVRVDPTRLTDRVSDQMLMRHELTHVVTGAHALPAWLSEGLAEYVAWQPHGGLTAALGYGRIPQTTYDAPEIPPTTGFASGDTQTNYLVSHVLIDFVIAMHRRAGLLQLIDGYDRRARSVQFIDAATADVLADAFDTTEQRLAVEALRWAEINDVQ